MTLEPHGVKHDSGLPSMRASRGVLLSITLFGMVFGSRLCRAQNAIVGENLLPGSGDWLTTRPAFHHEIEGYLSQASAVAGDSVQLFVSTSAPSYSVSVYRMGWYSGLGARLMTALGPFAGNSQPMPSPAPVTGLVECQWTGGPTLTIPPDWVTGIYLLRLEASNGFQSYVPLVLREAQPQSDLLFQSSATTWQAYNDWGGESLYSSITGPPNRIHAFKVSFDRPYAYYDLDNSGAPGNGQFLLYEYSMVRWLERQGYNISYTTNMDVQRDPVGLLPHRIFLSVGHDEYWSKEMRDNVEAARDAGVNLAFFSANSCYWQVRLEDSPLGPGRRVVSYKDDAQTRDPLYGVDNSRLTVRFRDRLVQRPENNLLGIQFEMGNYSLPHYFSPLRLQPSPDPAFGDIDPSEMTGLPGVVGFEYDTLGDNGTGAPGLEFLGASPVDYRFEVLPSMSYSTRYTASSGAQVFAAGTHAVGWTLDGTTAVPFSATVEKFTKDLLGEMLTRSGGTPPAGPSGGSPAPAPLDPNAGPGPPAADGDTSDATPVPAAADLPISEPDQNNTGTTPLTSTTDQHVTLLPQTNYLEPGAAFQLRVSVGEYDSYGGVLIGPGVDWSIQDGAGSATVDVNGLVRVSPAATDGTVIHVAATSREFGTLGQATVIVEIPTRWRSQLFAGRLGVWGFANGTVDQSAFYFPAGMATDPAGKLYVADIYNHLVRVVDGGVVGTLAGGTGYGFTDAQGSAARFDHPVGIVYQGGRLIVADTLNNAIRSVTLTGAVSTLASSGGTGDHSKFYPGFVDGPLSQAQFNHPTGLAVDGSGNVYVADTGNHAIRKISTSGQVTTVAGAGVPGFQDGGAGSSRLYFPYGLAWSSDGLWIADAGNHAIRRLGLDGTLATLAGTGAVGFSDGLASAAQFDLPTGLIVRPNGDVWIADYGNHMIRAYSPGAGLVTTILGSGVAGQRPGGDRTARLYNPFALLQTPDGRVYVSDQTALYSVTDFTPSSLVFNPGFELTAGSAAQGWSPVVQGYVVDSSVAHSGTNSIRMVNSVTTDLKEATQTVTLNQTTAVPIRFNGWSKASGVSGSPDNAYSLYLDVIYTDGTSLLGQTVRFSTGTHDWEQMEGVIYPTKPIRSINVYAVFRAHTGTAWFDDLTMTLINP